MWEAIFFIVMGILLLALSAKIIVDGAVAFSLIFRLKPVVIALTIIAIGTSLPELFVGITALHSGLFDLLIGNLIGSNLLNIGLVVGLSSMILPISIHETSRKYEWPIMFFITCVAAFFFLNTHFSRGEGILLFLLTAASTVFFVTLGRSHPEMVDHESNEEIERLEEKMRSQKKGVFIFKNSLLLIAGFFLVQFGSDIFVKGSTKLAFIFGISERVIGATLVALGTSLPELSVSLVATFKGRSDVALGNILGSNIFNIGGILGACAILKPFSISSKILLMDFPWLIFLSLLLFVSILKGEKISRFRGAVILSAYLVYATLLFL